MSLRVVNVTPSAVNRIENYPKTASVAGARGAWVNFASGYLAVAVSTAPKLLGIINQDWVNDANNTPVPIEVDEHGIYIMDITGGPLVQATHVGNSYDLSSTAGLVLNLGATTYKVLTVVGISVDGRAFVKNALPY